MQQMGLLRTPCTALWRTSSFRAGSTESSISAAQYESITQETLESLAERFEEILDDVTDIPEADLALSDGVLTVHFGEKLGTYVINKQTPNRQIWLSSPVSGPKRYDFVDNRWIYMRDNVSLHRLLAKEVSEFLKKDIDFGKCSYAA
ncbi:frataxin, mitochondrial-like isoform X2 [Ornithodoros turicata]